MNVYSEEHGETLMPLGTSSHAFIGPFSMQNALFVGFEYIRLQPGETSPDRKHRTRA